MWEGKSVRIILDDVEFKLVDESVIFVLDNVGSLVLNILNLCSVFDWFNANDGSMAARDLLRFVESESARPNVESMVKLVDQLA